MTRKQKLDLIFSVIALVWGGGLWFLLIRSRLYSNISAMVMASILVVVGTYYLIKSLRDLV